jgi:hypothetical protein
MPANIWMQLTLLCCALRRSWTRPLGGRRNWLGSDLRKGKKMAMDGNLAAEV